MKKLLFTFGGLILLTATCSMAQDARTILESAFQASAKASFKATMRNPIPPPAAADKILPYAEKWEFSRLSAVEGNFLRLDTFAKNKLVETYVKNESGIYGRAADGFAAKIIEVFWIWYPELTFLAIDPEELRLASCEYSQTTYGSIPCYRVVLRVPSDEASLMKITGEDREKFQANQARYRAGRVFTYEFIIGQQNSLIYSRRHYNLNSKLIFSIGLGEVDMTPPEREMFETPSKVQGEFMERNFFAGRVLEKMLARKEHGNGWLARTSQRLWSWTLRNGKYWAIAFGILSIAGIVFIKLKEQRG